jgi:3-hydroxyisobutyrate dehydrogenase-like beta-hydroxyacid dehydrogenase
MAKHLLGERHDVHVYDIDRRAVDELAELGAVGAASPVELARNCAHIGICVRDEHQVEQLLYGGSGLLEHAAIDTIIAIHSTVTQADILKWASAGQAARIRVIDAPITGGARGAEAGSLCYMLGGDEATVAAASPVFATSAEKIVHAGPVGSGILLKLCNNLITYAEFMAMSEATRLAEAGGLSAEVLREVGQSNGVINESMYQFISNRNALAGSCSEEQMDALFGVFGRLGEKDLDCALQCARDLGISLPSTAGLRETVYPLFMNKA